MTYPMGADNKDKDMENTGDSDVFERAEIENHDQQPVISQLLSEELPNAGPVESAGKQSDEDLLPPAVISKLHKKMKKVINDAFPPLV